MAEFKETVTTSKDQAVDKNGARIQQQTRKVNTDASVDGRSTAANIVWYILGVIEVLLAFRFVLKLLGANPESGFVDFIYTISGILTGPFDNIFGVSKTTSGETQSVFEPSILVAAAVYALVAWGIVKLVKVNRAG